MWQFFNVKCTNSFRIRFTEKPKFRSGRTKRYPPYLLSYKLFINERKLTNLKWVIKATATAPKKKEEPAHIVYSLVDDSSMASSHQWLRPFYCEPYTVALHKRTHIHIHFVIDIVRFEHRIEYIAHSKHSVSQCWSSVILHCKVEITHSNGTNKRTRVSRLGAICNSVISLYFLHFVQSSCSRILIYSAPLTFVHKNLFFYPYELNYLK